MADPNWRPYFTQQPKKVRGAPHADGMCDLCNGESLHSVHRAACCSVSARMQPQLFFFPDMPHLLGSPTRPYSCTCLRAALIQWGTKQALRHIVNKCPHMPAT